MLVWLWNASLTVPELPPPPSHCQTSLNVSGESSEEKADSEEFYMLNVKIILIVSIRCTMTELEEPRKRGCPNLLNLMSASQITTCTSTAYVDASASSTACCDLDLWPPESNQVISRGYKTVHCEFHWDCSSRSWDTVETRSIQTKRQINEQMYAAHGQPEKIMPLLTVCWQRHNELLEIS